jgi:hypothetical protein
VELASCAEDAFKCVNVDMGFSQQILEPDALALQLLHPPSVGGIHAASALSYVRHSNN